MIDKDSNPVQIRAKYISPVYLGLHIEINSVRDGTIVRGTLESVIAGVALRDMRYLSLRVRTPSNKRISVEPDLEEMVTVYVPKNL